MPSVCDPFVTVRARNHIEKGRVVNFTAGTGSPFFATDTTAALRAAEMGCEAFIKGTKVDGVYSANPKKHDRAAEPYESLSYQAILANNLKIMDGAAIAFAS